MSGGDCPACGSRIVASSVGAVADRGYHLAPMPVGNYSIPFGAPEILGAAFRMWSRDWGRLVLLAAIPILFSLPMIIGVAGVALFSFDKGDASVGNIIAMVGLGGVGVLVMLVGYLASMAAIIASVDERERTGANELPTWQAFLHGLSKVGRLFVVATATFGVLGLWGGTVALPIAVWRTTEAAPLLILPSVVLFPLVIWLMLRWAPLWVVAVVEDLPIGGTFSRALELTRGRVGTIFLAGILYALAIFGINFAGAILGLIPLVGMLVSLGLNLVMASLGPTWQFALYASLVNQK